MTPPTLPSLMNSSRPSEAPRRQRSRSRRGASIRPSRGSSLTSPGPRPDPRLGTSRKPFRRCAKGPNRPRSSSPGSRRAGPPARVRSVRSPGSRCRRRRPSRASVPSVVPSEIHRSRSPPKAPARALNSSRSPTTTRSAGSEAPGPGSTSATSLRSRDRPVGAPQLAAEQPVVGDEEAAPAIGHEALDARSVARLLGQVRQEPGSRRSGMLPPAPGTRSSIS